MKKEYKLVPIEPTQEMMDVGDWHCNGASCGATVWQAMLEKSPNMGTQDWYSAIMGLVRSNISRDSSGFITLSGIDYSNFIRAIDCLNLSEAAFSQLIVSEEPVIRKGIKNHAGQKLLVQHILDNDKGLSDSSRVILEKLIEE